MLALRLKELRAERDISQRELAHALNVSIGAIGNWESRTRMPDAEKLQQIADFFDVSVDYLLGRSDVKKKFFVPENENNNVVIVRGRNGSYEEKKLTDEQMKAVQAIIDQLPDAPDDL
jgi:transcriptional regulator with XRE-family HTH domain